MVAQPGNSGAGEADMNLEGQLPEVEYLRPQ